MKFETSIGRFDSTNIKISGDTSVPLTSDDLIQFDEIEKTKTAGALWLFIPESDIPNFFGFAKTRKYSYHHFENGCFVYSKWNNRAVENKIQPYATSISGAAMLVLNSDASKVLLVFEYGKFKCITGTTDYRELIITTGLRELKEEVGLSINQNFRPVICGGWNISNVKPAVGVNDMLLCYGVRVNDNDQIVLDKTELEDAKWFDVQFLLEAYDVMIGDFSKVDQSKSPHSDFFEYKGIRLSYVALLWLKNYLNNVSMHTLIQNPNTIIF